MIHEQIGHEHIAGWVEAHRLGQLESAHLLSLSPLKVRAL